MLQPHGHHRRTRISHRRCDPARLCWRARQAHALMRNAIAVALLGFAVVPATTGQPSEFPAEVPVWQVSLATSKDQDAGKLIAAQGKGAATACLSCHGANGTPVAGVPFPRLA